MAQDFRKYLSPDFQSAPPPELQWMPMEQDQTAGNMASIVDQLKQRESKGGGFLGGGGASGAKPSMHGMVGGGAKPGGGGGSL